MRIELNGARVETGAITLAELVAERGFPETAVATALDGAFVPRGARADTALAEDARVEVLTPMQGG